MTHRQLQGVWVFAWVGVVLPANEASGASGEAPLFSHAFHIDDQGAACTDCHAAAELGRLKLSLSICEDCHGEVPAYRFGVKARRLTLAFPHETHVGVAECRDCHGGTVADTLAKGELMVRPGLCLACHGENGVDAGLEQCAGCHGRDESKEKPSSHNAAWRAGHGAMLEAGVPKEHGQSCDLCHKGSDPCMSCHELTKPMFHGRHLDDRGAECSGCHNSEGRRTGFPGVNMEVCSDCHEVPPQRSRLQGGRGRRLEAAFPHQLHADAVDCLICHEATVRDVQKDGKPLVSQSECGQCHRDNGIAIAEANCAICHGINKQNVLPKDHRGTWTIRHGLLSEQRQGHGTSCDTCHSRAGCSSCHRRVAPASHNGLWRARLHGIVAPWQRERCQTCHETSACVSCHRRSKPIGHLGAWMATHGLVAQVRDDESCRVCHAKQTCIACHRGEGI